ncbi:MAG: LytTR family transcriptional regulator [Lachnospiraceae bacterium]|nr:LytTR family transcriptional regulator [Lachnospiraceae bacterium]
MADIKENVEIEINSLLEKQSLTLKLEDILYFEGDRNYTKLYISNHLKGDEKYKLLTKKIGELEKELKKYSIIRVHKSYMVNLHKVMSVEQNITLMGTEEKIPIGRAYKEEVRNRFIEFAKEKVRLRI